MCHSLPPKEGQGWHLMGVMLSAGGSLRWFRHTFAKNTDYAKLLEPAVAIPPGSEGLLFLPYLTGERTPHPDPFARGGFIGLTLRHGFAHMTRAVLEGVTFGLRDCLELLREIAGDQISQVRVSGGGSQSSLWRQILADVMNVELTTVNTTEGACYGAALLAGVGAGIWPSVRDACQSVVRLQTTTTPIKSHTDKYNAYYQDYRSLYPALKDVNRSLGIKAQ
jgi:xylulokinase